MARLQVVMDPLETDEESVSLRTPPLTREQYRAFCEANPDLRIERLSTGEVIIMPPAHSRSAALNAEIVHQLKAWAKVDGRGISFDSSAGFDLPNGSNRGPDAAWVSKARLTALLPEERDGYLPLSPDFVVEVRSRSDRLRDLRAKLQEYIDNGTELGWLIDPLQRKVYIYRPGVDTGELANPATISGDPELPGFQLDLAGVWDPGF